MPFSVNSAAQAGAEAALRCGDRLEERVGGNDLARAQLEDGLAARGIDYVPSQTNFVLFHPDGDAAELSDSLLRQGVIVRPMGQFIRVTVGTPDENERFLRALDPAR